MKNLIDVRIEELEKYVTNLRIIIEATNKDILEAGFVPNEQQKTLIKHFANQGKKALADIETLEKLLLTNEK